MEELRHGMLVLCSGCILYGILENLLPRRGTGPVIKAVLLLYIVLISLSPQAGLPLGEKTGAAQGFIRQEAALPTMEYDVGEAAGRVLQRRLEAALTDAPVRVSGVRLHMEKETLLGAELTLEAGPGTDRAALEERCNVLLGVPVTYQWNGGLENG